jgi:hypothetical protein
MIEPVKSGLTNQKDCSMKLFLQGVCYEFSGFGDRFMLAR